MESRAYMEIMLCVREKRHFSLVTGKMYADTDRFVGFDTMKMWNFLPMVSDFLINKGHQT